MTRRNLELLLLCIAAPIVIVLFGMMVVNGGQELTFNTLGVPLGIFVAFVIAHLAVRRFAPLYAGDGLMVLVRALIHI